MTPTIGVDPGARSGACVMLSPSGVVLDWMVWWQRSAVVALQQGAAEPRDLDPAQGLGGAVAWWRDGLDAPCGWRLHVEGLHSTGKGAHSMLKLAEACGEVLGVLRQRCDWPVLRPRAQRWRQDVLRLHPSTTAKRAEAYAVEMAMGGGLGLTWPRGVPELPRVPTGALAEACCIALWEER